MNAASSGEPARGVVVGRLNESHPDRIVVGSSTTCGEGAHPVETFLGVTHTTEQDGSSLVDLLEPRSEAGAGRLGQVCTNSSVLLPHATPSRPRVAWDPASRLPRGTLLAFES